MTTSDRWSARVVVSTICAALLLLVCALGWRLFNGHDIPDKGLALLTLLVGVLVPSPLSKAQNPEVSTVPVTTAPGDSLAVRDAHDEGGYGAVELAVGVLLVLILLVVLLRIL